MKKSLLIRADANAQIGAGHTMRCLALAQGWQDAGGSVTFVTATNEPFITSRLEKEGMRVLLTSVERGSFDDAMQTARLAGQ